MTLADHLQQPIDDFIDRYDPCAEAIDWLRTQPDLATAWEKCERGDWLLWSLNEFGLLDNRLAATIACRMVRETPLHDGRTVWDLLTDERSRKAVETTEAWLRGEAALNDVRAAAYAAYAAADDAAAAYAAADDAYAAAAAYAAADDAYAAAYAAARKVQADLIRQMIEEVG